MPWFVLIRDGGAPVQLKLSNMKFIKLTSVSSLMCTPGIFKPCGVMHAIRQVGDVLVTVMTEVIVVSQRLRVRAGLWGASIEDVGVIRQ